MAASAAINRADILERLLELSDRLQGLLGAVPADSPPGLLTGLRTSAAEVSALIEEVEDVLDAQEAEAALAEARQVGTVPLDKFEETLDR